MKFFRCKHCGNIIAYVQDNGVKVMCCGEAMQEIVAGSVDASREKHVPVVVAVGQNVEVSIGAVAHPMAENHHIQWVAIQTMYGNQRKELAIGQEPKVCFALCAGDKVEAVYAYCNLHGLWKA